MCRENISKKNSKNKVASCEQEAETTEASEQ